MKQITVAFDIHNKHPHLSTDDLHELVGMIPTFILDALEHEAMPLHEAMNAAYQFASPEMTGGTVHEDGRYSYPDDPDLYPIATFGTARGVVHVYLYGITAICETGTAPVVYRFD